MLRQSIYVDGIGNITVTSPYRRNTFSLSWGNELNQIQFDHDGETVYPILPGSVLIDLKIKKSLVSALLEVPEIRKQLEAWRKSTIRRLAKVSIPKYQAQVKEMIDRKENLEKKSYEIRLSGTHS